MPRQHKLLNLQFPMGGLDRRYGFQSQPPYTTPNCLNVRPDSVHLSRQRGGSRPGVGPAFRETLGSGNPIRLLSAVDVVQQNGQFFWQDTFEGTSVGSVWSTASWLAVAPTVANRKVSAVNSLGPTGLVRAAFSPTIATSADYVVEMWIAPTNGQHDGTYTLFARMSDASPNASTGGVQARLTMTGTTGAFSGSLLVDGTTTVAFTSGTDSYPAAGWFTMRISGNNVSCYWRNATLLAATAIAGPTGQRVGFGLSATVSGGTCTCDRFRVQYFKTGQTQNSSRRVLMASSNGTLYRETELGSLTSIGGSLTLASDRTLMASQRTQLLYIADHGDWKGSGTDGVRGTGNTKFDAASVSDWTTLGITTADDVLVLSSMSTSAGTAGVYQISSVASGELTLSTAPYTATGSTCTWRIERGPKKYTHSTNALALWIATSGLGFVPVGCPIICTYRDRMVLAGGADGEHIWYMSRQGDPLDWDYSAEDVGRAVAGSATDAGIVGDPIRAVIPHGDACVLFGCATTLWILRGDPAYGGQIDNMSRRVGIVDKRAWCYVPSNSGDDGLIVFLSLDGLFMVPAGCQTSSPVSISREKLPEEMLDIDRNLVEVSMSYDSRAQGIHIFLTKLDSGNTTHWFFSWTTKGFFPMSLTTAHEPHYSYEMVSTCSEDSCVLLGGRDGKIRRFHPLHAQDDGANSITSYVDFGPLLLGERAGWGQGCVSELQGELGTDSASVTAAIRVGQTPEDAYGASAQYSATWSQSGLQYVFHPRCTGQTGFLKLTNGTTLPWTFERALLRIQPQGRNSR